MSNPQIKYIKNKLEEQGLEFVSYKTGDLCYKDYRGAKTHVMGRSLAECIDNLLVEIYGGI